MLISTQTNHDQLITVYGVRKRFQMGIKEYFTCAVAVIGSGRIILYKEDPGTESTKVQILSAIHDIYVARVPGFEKMHTLKNV